jgi:hypothetical protein
MTAADDMVLPGFFEKALAMVREHPRAGLVYGKMAMTNDAGELLYLFEVSAWPMARFATPEQFLCDHLEREEPGHSLCAATIYRRDALQAFGGYRTELGHWMDTFIARAIGLCHGVCYVPETFMQWRWSPQGYAASNKWNEQARIVKRAAELMRSEPFCQWFPGTHAAWWERTALENLFCSRVMDRWPLLRRWNGTGGWRTRLARPLIRSLARLGRWRWERTAAPASAQAAS